MFVGPRPFGDHRGPLRMGVRASSAMGAPRPPSHLRGGLLRFGATYAPAAWVWGPPLLWEHRSPRPIGVGPPQIWDHRGPYHMGEGASTTLGPPRPRRMDVEAPSLLGPPRPPPHVQGHLLRFETMEAPAAWARGPPQIGDHLCPRRMSVAPPCVL